MIDHPSSSAILDVMVGVTLLSPQHESEPEEPRVLLHDVPWSTYIMLSDSVDSPNVHMTYLEGQLEIMTKSTRHEVNKTQIARLVELFCLERDIPLYGYGETTIRRKAKKRGLEPDEWYCRGEERWPPDIALEVVVTNPLIDKLEVYRGLGIREVWVWKDGVIRVLALRKGKVDKARARSMYEVIDASELIPELDFARIAHYLSQPDQHMALKAFRDEIRGVQ